MKRPSLTCLRVTDMLSFPVHFRYVVFHPFLDEILIGKIKGCSPEGVHGNGGPDSSETPGSTGRGRRRGRSGWGSGQARWPPFSFCAGPRGQERGQIQKQTLPGESENIQPLICSCSGEDLSAVSFTVRRDLRASGSWSGRR